MAARSAEVVAESPSAIWSRVNGTLRALGGGIVEGEVQQVSHPASGHVYFTLTDGEANVRCTMWRSSAQHLPAPIEQGAVLQARYTRVEVYAKRGDISLIVDAVRGVGEGELLQRILDVRERLVADGLADPAGKPPLPRFPRRVGLVTAKGSDAEADVVTALRHRFPPVRISACYAAVQGATAPGELIEALMTLDAQPEVDVIVLARGGGSVEDLLAFSDEGLCRAISALRTPVITSIGHTRQQPNCDVVATAAAEVPARAAEHAVPSAAELGLALERLAGDAEGFARAAHADALARVERSAMRPAGQAAIDARRGRIDLHAQLLAYAGDGAARAARDRVADAALGLQAALGLLPRPATLDVPRERLEQAAAAARHRVELGGAALGATLGLIRARDWRERGFALVRLPDGALVRDGAGLAAGQAISIQMKGATLDATVDANHPTTEDAP